MALSNQDVTLPEHFEAFAASRKFSESIRKPGGGLKKSTLHHIRSRAVAELLWSMVPELTIVEMARRSEIIRFGCEGQEYNVRTICRWLANLKNDRRPGRPKKRMQPGIKSLRVE